MVNGLVIKDLKETMKQSLAQATYAISTSGILVKRECFPDWSVLRRDLPLHVVVCGVVAVSLLVSIVIIQA